MATKMNNKLKSELEELDNAAWDAACYAYNIAAVSADADIAWENARDAYDLAMENASKVINKGK